MGYEAIFAVTDDYRRKICSYGQGEACLQFHEVKDETIYLHSGQAEVEIREPGHADDVHVVAPGAAFRIRPGTLHRLRALEDSTFLEVSTPHLDDVVRVEDRYGRPT